MFFNFLFMKCTIIHPTTEIILQREIIFSHSLRMSLSYFKLQNKFKMVLGGGKNHNK